VPVYDRNEGKPRAKPLLWISYSITESQRIRFGLKSRTVREAAGTGDKRIAKAIEAQRRRDVVADEWAPRGHVVSGARTVRRHAEEWLLKRATQGVLSVNVESTLMRTHVLPAIGEMALADVRRHHLVDLVSKLNAHVSVKTGKTLAPRTVHSIYSALRLMFVDAIEVQGILQVSPCTLKEKRGELPPKKDRDPRWRSGAVYTRDEAETLMSDERIPAARRMTYALLFMTGMRLGEAVGRRWGEYDTAARPLGRLVVATQYNDQPLKTENPRDVPVHPALAKMLAEWKLSGWPKLYGRSPTASDFIVPIQLPDRNGHFAHQTDRRVWKNLQRDLETLGMRNRRVHDSRRAFVTLARADGARPDLLRWVTHGPSGSMQDLYTSPPWATLCEQVSCLQLGPKGNAPVAVIRPRNHPAVTDAAARSTARGLLAPGRSPRKQA
jgi:integrase